jgi:integrase
MPKKLVQTYLTQRDAGKKALSPKIKLTQAIVGWLPIKSYDYSIGDSTVPSLFVRVRQNTGSKTFYIVRKINRKVIRSKICSNGERPFSVGDKSVLVQARAMIAEIYEGKTPASKRADVREAAEEAEKLSTTLGQACNAYIRAKVRAENTTKGYERFRDNHLQHWCELQLASITEDDIADLHDEITKEAGGVAANNVARFFRAVWKYHRRRLKLGDCPTIIFTKEGDSVKSWNAENRRTRYVAKEELKPWWQAIERLRNEYAGDGDLAADYLQFAMLTGLRRREITRLKWEDVNQRRRTFLIPDNKSKRPYAVPLSDVLEAILDRRAGSSRPFSIEEPKKFIAKVAEWSGVPFSTHDLRRSFLSHATAVNISLPVQKDLVNHSRKNDVTDGYIQIDIDTLRDASEKVQSYILTWAGCIKKVVPLGVVASA